MNEDEAAQHKAEHKAAALHHLGWETGAGAAVWARAVQDELARHESARERFGASPDREDWERLHSSALMLVVAIDQVLAFERRVRRITGDADLAQARARFDALGPDAEALRDLVVHLDSYAAGEGWRQTGQGETSDQRPVPRDLHLLGEWWRHDLGPRKPAAKPASGCQRGRGPSGSRRASQSQHLERAEQDANAALWRRYGQEGG